MVGNGQGKSRASRTGSARAIKRWRTFLLSTGERTIGATMAEGGYRVKAGQAVRILDVRADGRAYGVFDNLCGFKDARALADGIKEAAATHYGVAGRAFLERLTREDRDLGEWLAVLKATPQFTGASEQEGRAGARFALIALAGELATDYGITGWPDGTALAAATEGFRLWKADRGKGQTEPRQILEAVTDYLDRHGDNRFSYLKAAAGSEAAAAVWVRDRAGWHDGTADQSGRVYYMTSGAIREAAKGFDFKRVLDVLADAGALPAANAKGERAKPTRTPEGEVKKLYPVTYAKLGGATDGD
jgi:putative DNA primase/helicase